ncbi:MAG: NACHT domain-containing protein, partial [Myxococcota bacterium]
MNNRCSNLRAAAATSFCAMLLCMGLPVQASQTTQVKDTPLKPAPQSQKSQTQQLQSLEEKLQQLKQERLADKNIARERLDVVYVPLQGSMAYQQEGAFDLQEYVLEQLQKEEEKNPWKVLALLGDTGAGKSTFTRHLEHTLWQQWQGPQDYLPLWVSLPTLTDYKEYAVNETLGRYGFTENEIDELQNNYRFLLILDGYDELLDYVNVYDENGLKEWKGRVLISSRVHYFNSVSGTYSTYLHPEAGVDGSLGLTVYTAAFSSTQRDTYMQQYLQENKSLWNVDQYKEYINNNEDLQRLASRPFVLRMLMQVLPGLVRNSSHIGINSIYDAFMGDWFYREIDKEEERLRAQRDGFDGFDEKERKDLYNKIDVFVMKLAHQMNKKGVQQVLYKASGRKGTTDKDSFVWKEFFGGNGEEAKWLMRAAPLTAIKCQSGHQWSFLHKSLQEYYANKATVEGITSSSASDAFNESVQKLLEDYQGRMKDNFEFIIESARDPKQDKFRKALWELVNRSKREKIGYAASNAITILSAINEIVPNLDLSSVRIPQANLRGGMLSGINFSDADLQDAIVDEALLDSAVFAGANVRGLRFGQGASFTKHERGVNGVSFAPISLWKQGKRWAASASDDQTVHMWDVTSGQTLKVFKGHTPAVTSISFSPDGCRLASASADQIVRLWDVNSEQALK